jgi:uncharacterized protein YbjT (DUF2867 family)
MRIVVTGGSGKAGRWVVKDLRDHGRDFGNRRQERLLIGATGIRAKTCVPSGLKRP